MKYLNTTMLIGFVFILSLSTCMSTRITVPEIQEKTPRQGITLKIEYKNIPGETSIATYTPQGKKSGVKNEPGKLDTLMIPAIEKIVKNKGYTIVNSADTAIAVLTIDFADFGIYWMTSVFSSASGEIKANITHSISRKNSPNIAWKWDYAGSKKYGKLPGNCLVSCLSFTIIGAIPVLIYINSQGGFEDTQMTKAGNEMLKEYFKKLDESLPDSGVLGQRL